MLETPRPIKRPSTTPIMIGVVLLLVAALAIVGIFGEVSGQDAFRNTEQLSNLLLTRSTIFGFLVDMETSERGYVITGNETFLQPYQDAQKKLPDLWANMQGQAAYLVRQNTSGAQGLSQQIALMKQKADTWQQQIAEPEIVLRRAGRTQEVFSSIATGKGKELFDQVRQSNAQTESTIDTMSRQNNSELNRINTLNLELLIGLGVLSIASAVLTVRVAHREAHLQEEAVLATEAERERLQAIVENVPLPVRLVSSNDSNVILQNRAAEELLPAALWNAMTPAQRIEYYSFTKGDGEPFTPADFPSARTFKDGVPVKEFDFSMTRPEIGTRNLLVSTSPLRDEQGKITTMIVTLQDVTRMIELDRRKDEFIATAAHELRNPLAVLSGHSQLLQRMARNNAPPNVLRHADEINKQVNRVNALVARLLDASRIQLGRLSLDRSPVDLVEIALAVAGDATTADNNEHSIKVIAPAEPVMGDYDPTRIEQVMTNLVGNALRYSPPNTEVKIQLQRQDGQALVQIIDQGPGVPASQRAHLFERYYQTGSLHSKVLSPETTDMPMTKRQGLGLGLYISSEIVKAHGGKIGVEPNPEGGSIFWFTLPAPPARTVPRVLPNQNL